jgi:hypothetical protein
MMCSSIHSELTFKFGGDLKVQIHHLSGVGTF